MKELKELIACFDESGQKLSLSEILARLRVIEAKLAEQPAPVQHFDHTAAANSALRDAQNRSYQIAKCKYPKCSYPCTDLPDCRDAEQQAQQEPAACLKCGAPLGALHLATGDKNCPFGQRVRHSDCAPQPAQQDEFKAAYIEAMVASNEAGFSGMTAAETIRELSRMVADKPAQQQPLATVIDQLAEGMANAECAPDETAWRYMSKKQKDQIRSFAAYALAHIRVNAMKIQVGRVFDCGSSTKGGWHALVHFDERVEDGSKVIAAAPQPAQQQPVVPKHLDVRRIILDIVPGDGSGFEVHAKTVEDVEGLLAKMSERIEELEQAQQQEPVAVVDLRNANYVRWLEGVKYPTEGVPLYTSPQAQPAQRKSLTVWTEAQHELAYRNSPELHKDVKSLAAFKRVAKEIAAMYGIKENT